LSRLVVPRIFEQSFSTPVRYKKYFLKTFTSLQPKPTAQI
jgi:hypothetical protein